MEVKTIEDVLRYIDCGIINNNSNSNYRLYMNMIHNFVLESGEIHFDYQFDLLNKANYILVRLYETSNEELKKEHYEMRRLILQS